MKLTGLKPGDTVVIQQYGDYRPYLFATVKEVGAKKIKTDKGDFSATHGRLWGGSEWTSPFIRDDYTVAEAEELNKEIEKRLQRSALARKLSDVRWRNLPLEVLEQVDAIVTAATLPPAAEAVAEFCDCDEPTTKSDSSFCEFCELPIRQPRTAAK
jgi:hypothetical protein